MDLSKLPRLSETDKHAPPPPADGSAPPGSGAPVYAQPRLEYGVAPQDISGQVWLSVVLGIVFMFMGGSFARFAIAKLTGQTYHTGSHWLVGPKAGQEVSYYELQGYTGYTDTAVFLFGLAMVLEAGMLVISRQNTPTSRAFVALAMGISAVMTVFNMILCGLLFQSGVTPLTSLLAAGFGSYMTYTEWQIFQRMRATAARA